MAISIISLIISITVFILTIFLFSRINKKVKDIEQCTKALSNATDEIRSEQRNYDLRNVDVPNGFSFDVKTNTYVCNGSFVATGKITCKEAE